VYAVLTFPLKSHARTFGPPCGEEITTICQAVSIEYRNVTDRQTDRRTDRQTDLLSSISRVSMLNVTTLIVWLRLNS